MKKIVPLMFGCFLTFVALSMVVPFLPYVVEGMHGGRFLASAIFSVFSLGSFVASPFWGRCSDKYGRRLMLVVSGVLASVAYIWLGVAGSVLSLVLSRAFAGVCSAWSVIAAAYVADVTDEKNRSHGMAMIGIAFGLGFTVGPLLQSLLLDHFAHDYFLPSMVAAVINFFAVVVVLLSVKDAEVHKERRHSLGGMWSHLCNKNVILLLLVYGGVYFTFTGFEGVFTIWGLEKFQLTAADIGLYLGFSGVVMIFTQGGMRSMVRRFDEKVLLMVALLLLLLSIVMVPFLQSKAMLYVMMGVLSVAIGLHNPLMQSFISRAGNKHNIGSLMGSAQSVASFARVIAPTIMGALYAEVSVNSPFYLGIFVTFCTVIAGYLYFYRYMKRDVSA